MPASAIPRCRWRPWRGSAGTEGRIAHARGALQQFLTTCERGSPVALETGGTWDLDRGRDRSGWPAPAAGPCAPGEAHAGHGDQDRYARRAGTEPAPAHRDAPPRGDPARRPAGPARPPPHPQDADPRAHPAQAPDPCYPGPGPGSGSRAPVPWSVAAAARGVRRRSPASHRTAGTTTERLRDHLDLGTGQILGCAQRRRPVVAPTP